MPLDRSHCAATYKILVLGDASVGKTALLKRLIGREFQERLYPTIATDFIRKCFEVDGALIELQIWDTAGSERFRSVTRWQFKGVKGVAMIYDVTNRDTFTHLSYWIRCVNEEISQSHNKYEAVPIVLLGNKADLEEKRQVRMKDGVKLADKEMVFAFLETSAKTGQNVFNAFRKLAYDVTEICDPSVMKSYHPRLIRSPLTETTPTCIGCKATPTRHRITPTGDMVFPNIVKYSKSKQKAEIQTRIGKFKRKRSKWKWCCCVR